MSKPIHTLFSSVDQTEGASKKIKQAQQTRRILRGEKARDVIREEKSTTLYRGTELLEPEDEYEDDGEKLTINDIFPLKKKS